MTAALTYLALVFSVITFVFYVIGSAGYNKSVQGYETSAWITSGSTYLETNGVTLNYILSGGLRGYLIQATTTATTTDAVRTFTTAKWPNSSACKLNGYATAGLLITGLALIAIGIVFNILVLTDEQSTQAHIYKWVAVVLSFTSFVVGVIGVTIFMDPFYGGCVHSLNRSTGTFGLFSYQYGPGAIISTAGFSTALFAFLLNLASLKTPSTPTPSTSNVNYTPNPTNAPNVESGASYT